MSKRDIDALKLLEKNSKAVTSALIKAGRASASGKSPAPLCMSVLSPETQSPQLRPLHLEISLEVQRHLDVSVSVQVKLREAPESTPPASGVSQ